MPVESPQISDEPGRGASQADYKGSVDRLLTAVRSELLVHDTEHPVFHGAWDWHSSVHGHWALLVLGDLRGRRSDSQWVIERLRTGAWRTEVKRLADEPSFELPYGRAWLLALMSAYERITGDRDLRRAMTPVVDQLHQWCTSAQVDPNALEYENPCWPLLHLWRWWDADPATRRPLEELIRDRFMGHDLTLDSDRDPPGTFFSRWALVAHLLGGTLGSEALAHWLSDEDINPTTIEPLTELRSAHHLGMNATRAWGFWSAYKATGDRRWRDTYVRHVEASIALHAAWHDDRYAYKHWVPQFTLYAIHLAAEDWAPMKTPGSQ